MANLGGGLQVNITMQMSQENTAIVSEATRQFLNHLRAHGFEVPEGPFGGGAVFNAVEPGRTSVGEETPGPDFNPSGLNV